MSACACTPAAKPQDDQALGEGGCSSGEAFALRVLGAEMEPEFQDGDIIIVEPDGALRDGRYVVAQVAGEWLFRQLRQGPQGWRLAALAGGLPEHPLPDLAGVRGVVIQKAVPGRRRLSKFYV